ncbi:hypothetical protein SAMN05443550_110192 [Pedobacter hartonius]|uniref:Uncharacterized protein n=1 Tax=Pedobacter hartonius TaxID=425514 RepID=A0A1H4GM34_9SPHI|nr:hypothetical protein SAMN05443550_110192 [Pedobacter hartonius]
MADHQVLKEAKDKILKYRNQKSLRFLQGFQAYFLPDKAELL